MLSKLLSFELKLQTRQVGFWVTCLILFLFGILLTGTDVVSLGSDGGERVKTNGSITIANSLVALSLLTLFFAAVFTVTGVMRDEEHKSLEIIHATPIKTFDMAFSRMTGVFIATFLCVLAGVIGMFAGQFLPSADKEAFGAFKPLFYVQPIVLYLGINAFLVSSIYMAVAAITRNKSLVYVSAVALFALYSAVGIFLGENSPDLIATLADPFGGAPLAIVTEFWTPLEQNEKMMPLLGLIGLNRLVYFLAALAIFALTLAMFKRGMVKTKTKRRKEELAADTQPIRVTNAAPNTGSSANLAAFFARLKLEYFTIIKSVPFIILTLIAIALFVTNIYYAAIFEADPTLPTSASMVNIVIGSFGLSMLIITVFFGGDIMWRERSVNIHEILDATPVKNGVLVASKWTALFAVILTLILLGILTGMIAQLILGDVPLNPWTYLKIGIAAFALGMLIDAVLVMFLQNFMPGRVIGMLAAGGLVIGFGFLTLAPFYHPLMRFGGGVSPGAYSEINGFNGLADMGGWFGYWGGLMLVFLVLTIWLWRRGTETSLKSRLKGFRAQIGPVSGAVAALGIAGFFGFGGMIYKKLNVDQDYRNSKAAEKYSVEYEKQMKPLTELPLPKIRSVEVDVNFRPSKQDAVVSGSYRMENVTGEPLETLYVQLASDHEKDNRVLTIEGATAALDGEDAKQLKDYGLRRFTFNPPLPAGEFTQMTFETYFHPPRFGDGSQILKNGTFVNNGDVMPSLGVPKNFLSNPDKRRKYGLPERDKRPARDDMKARQNSFFGPSADYVDFKATMCTDADQIAIAPGTLLRRYEKNGQACRDYEANRPILNFFSFISQDYVQERDVWKGENGQEIDIVIYYHAAHNYNVPLMMKAAKSAMDTFTQEYGPYQYEQVRIMEFPYGGFAQAFAGTIPFSENIGFVQNPGDPEDPDSVDLATYVTMHEIGHQWFAHQIVPADTQGFNVLSEGLTENAAMTAYERELGWGKARRILKQRSIQRYLTGRTSDPEDELPLATQEGKSYQDYAKSSWVFWGLRHTVGADVVNGAMKKLIEDYGSKGPPYPTTIQVVDYLKEAVGPEFHQLVSDYWDRITFWDMKYGESDISVSENADGTFKVSFEINIDKLVTPEDGGKEVSVSELDDVTLNELVEVGFYTEDPTEALGGGWFAKERVRLTQKETSVSFDVKTRPTHILLDPQRLLFERNDKDNLKEVDPKPQPAN